MKTDTSAPLLDFIESQKLRDRGIQLSSEASPEWVQRARSVAKHLAAKNGEVTINDVYRVVGLPDRPNAAGSVFAGKAFRCVGIDQSARPERHAGIIRRWSLK